MKKIILFALILSMLVCSVMPISIAAEGESAPVEISTREQFEAIQKNGNYVLTNDIDFGGKIYANYIVQEFNGTLDGAGHTLKNIVIAGGAKDSGIFQYLARKDESVALIKNLYIGTKEKPVKMDLNGNASAHGVLSGAHNRFNSTLNIENVHIVADVEGTMTGGGTNFGGFLGASQRTIFKNCTMDGSISINAVNWDCNAAGFSGMPKYAKGIFENCINYADISVQAKRTARAGGITGYTSYAVDLINCINYGEITNTYGDTAPTHARFGGIVAEFLLSARKENVPGDADKNGTIEEGEVIAQPVEIPENENTINILGCQNFGNVHSAIYAGAIMGYNAKGTAQINNCINYGKATTSAENTLGGFIVGYAEASLTASGNKDASRLVKDEISDKVAAYGVQSTAVENDKYSVRFVALIDSLDYTSVGFELQVYYNSNGVLKSKAIKLEGQNVYSVLKTGESGSITAPEGKYFAALSISNVPAEAANGDVRFVFTPFAKNGENVIYGDAVMCAYSNGTLSETPQYIR